MHAFYIINFKNKYILLRSSMDRSQLELSFIVSVYKSEK